MGKAKRLTLRKMDCMKDEYKRGIASRWVASTRLLSG
jgi:hypothetical protein